MAWIDSLPTAMIDGVTISGGEPFDQPEALGSLLRAIREAEKERSPWDVLVYTGYPLKRALERMPHAQQLADILITDPFQENRDMAWLRGSTNQGLRRMSKLGRARYPEPEPPPTMQLQLMVAGDGLQVIGIPARGDIRRLGEELFGSGCLISSITTD